MKKHLKQITVIILLSFTFVLTSQELKQYSGNYKEAEYATNGKATYTYKEVDYVRKYEGNFSYKSDDNGFGLTKSISGQFLNDKKTGTWIFGETQTNGKMLGTAYNGYKTTAKGSYQNGKKQGLWVYTRIENITNEILIKTHATFKDNVLVGELEYFQSKEYPWDTYSKYYTNNISFNCKYDSAGNFNGDWKLTYESNKMKFEELRKYTNGKLTWSLNRNLSTGEVICKKEYLDSDKDKCVTTNHAFAIYSWEVDNEQYNLGKSIKLGLLRVILYGEQTGKDVRIAKEETKRIEEQKLKDEQTKIEEQKYEEDKRKKEEQLLSEYNTRIDIANEFYNKGKYNEAKLKYEEALKYKNDDYPKNKIEELEVIINKNIERQRDSVYNELIKQGEEHLRAKNYKLALDVFSNAQKTNAKMDLQSQIDKTKDSIVYINIRKSDSLMALKKFTESLKALSEVEKYLSESNKVKTETKKTLLRELNNLKQTAYNNKYETITYTFERGGSYSKTTYENYKTLFVEAEKIQDLDIYIQRLKCLSLLNDNIHNRLLGDADGVNKDLKKSEKFITKICTN